MVIFKIFGALMIALCGALGAYMLNAAARLALSQTEGFVLLIRHLRNEIECFSMPIPSALLRCPRSVYEKCGYAGNGVPQSVSELVEGCGVSDSESVALIGRFASGIGKGYRDDQLALCDYYLELLEERRRTVSEQLPQRTKRNSALCICGALAVVILLI